MKLRFITGLGLMLTINACSPIAPSLSKTTTSAGAEVSRLSPHNLRDTDEPVERTLRIPVRVVRILGSAEDSSSSASTSTFTLALSPVQIETLKRDSSVEITLPSRSLPETVQGLVKVEQGQPLAESEVIDSLITLKQKHSGAWALTVREVPLEHIVSFTLLFENESTTIQAD